MPLICITCGSSMPDDADFCPSCGRIVVREIAGEPEAAQAPAVPDPPAIDSGSSNSETRIESGSTADAAIPEPATAHASAVQLPPPPNEPTRSANPHELKSSVEARDTVPLPPPVLAPNNPRPTPNRPAPTRPSSTSSASLPKSSVPRTKTVEKSRETFATGSQATLNDRLLAAAAYLTFLPAVVFLLIRRYQRRGFIRFHAWQSIFFWILIAVLAGIGMLASTFGFLLVWLVTGILVVVALFLTWLVLEIKALRGEWFHLPWVGTLAGHVGNA